MIDFPRGPGLKGGGNIAQRLRWRICCITEFGFSDNRGALRLRLEKPPRGAGTRRTAAAKKRERLERLELQLARRGPLEAWTRNLRLLRTQQGLFAVTERCK